MSDLAERLKAAADPAWNPYHNVYKSLLLEASEAIERLEKDLVNAQIKYLAACCPLCGTMFEVSLGGPEKYG